MCFVIINSVILNPSRVWSIALYPFFFFFKWTPHPANYTVSPPTVCNFRQEQTRCQLGLFTQLRHEGRTDPMVSFVMHYANSCVRHICSKHRNFSKCRIFFNNYGYVGDLVGSDQLLVGSELNTPSRIPFRTVVNYLGCVFVTWFGIFKLK